MPSEQIGEYEIDYSAVELVDHQGWAAHVAIFGPSANPMHRNILIADHRVAIETVFQSAQEAERQARQAALDMMEQGAHHRAAT